MNLNTPRGFHLIHRDLLIPIELWMIAEADEKPHTYTIFVGLGASLPSSINLY
ncbi:MAG: hypothetical protein G5Z42_07060 [Caldisphaeraceae archaeon]|nr:hypothetical protein [Caldisphaeraceae archaeon]MEB3691800.1 hypothetical protein [Caldisphaeraceae archaeon]MEB3798556.1 hypothetical protein [Caldisphaeraceae archaeon]